MKLARSWILIACASVAAVGATSARAAEPPNLIVYYDPDGNYAGIVQMSRHFNDYLVKKKTKLVFQPVARSEDLESLLMSGRTALAIVSSTYLAADTRFRLKPAFVQSQDGDSFYSKVLVDTGEGNGRELIGAIATSRSSANGALAEAHVRLLLTKSGIDLSAATFTLVDRDIDAILGVAPFRRAKAALVTRQSLEFAKTFHPKATEKLRTIYETPRILRPVLCSLGKDPQPASVLEVLEKMHDDSVGRDALGLMGVDRWVPFKPEMTQTP